MCMGKPATHTGAIMEVAMVLVTITSLCLNNNRPVALTPVIMKCSERIVLRYIKDFIPRTLVRHQLAYRRPHQQSTQSH